MLIIDYVTELHLFHLSLFLKRPIFRSSVHSLVELIVT